MVANSYLNAPNVRQRPKPLKLIVLWRNFGCILPEQFYGPGLSFAVARLQEDTENKSDEQTTLDCKPADDNPLLKLGEHHW